MVCYVQGPHHNQMVVAEALGLPAHKVVARTKRLGGGFGGKETRAIPLSVAAALPAWKLRRPVRLIQDRDEDMHTSGHRHAFIGKYKVNESSSLWVVRTHVECSLLLSALHMAVTTV